MRRSSFVILANVGFAWAALHAADATRPIDYTDRNTPFAPQATVQPDKRSPTVNSTVQEKRVTPSTVDKQPAAVGERRAAIDVNETREKQVLTKDVQTPETVERQKSRFDQQRARISTSENTNKPPTVAKYQDSLAAASASNMARFPALDKATNAKINRFVFRKNGGELANAPAGASVVPAAGGSTLTK